jgi:hypothetical protein
MVSLIDAIIAKFTSASLGSTITGGIFYQEAASGTSLPYVVVTVIAAPLVDAYANSTHADVTVQFALFSEGLRAGAVLMASLMTAYDTTLTISGGTNIDHYRLGDAIPMLQPQDDTSVKDESSKDVWGHYVSYVYSVQ